MAGKFFLKSLISITFSESKTPTGIKLHDFKRNYFKIYIVFITFPYAINKTIHLVDFENVDDIECFQSSSLRHLIFHHILNVVLPFRGAAPIIWCLVSGKEFISLRDHTCKCMYMGTASPPSKTWTECTELYSSCKKITLYRFNTLVSQNLGLGT